MAGRRPAWPRGCPSQKSPLPVSMRTRARFWLVPTTHNKPFTRKSSPAENGNYTKTSSTATSHKPSSQLKLNLRVAAGRCAARKIVDILHAAISSAFDDNEGPHTSIGLSGFFNNGRRKSPVCSAPGTRPAIPFIQFLAKTENLGHHNRNYRALFPAPQAPSLGRVENMTSPSCVWGCPPEIPNNHGKKYRTWPSAHKPTTEPFNRGHDDDSSQFGQLKPSNWRDVLRRPCRFGRACPPQCQNLPERQSLKRPGPTDAP